MANPFGDPDNVRSKTKKDPLPDWRQYLPAPPVSPDPSPYIPAPIVPPLTPHPVYRVQPLPYIDSFTKQGAPSVVPFPRFSDFLNEDGSLKPVSPDTPPAGGLLGIIEQYLRNNGQR